MRKNTINLKHYSALAGVITLGGIQNAQSQIIYTDVEPDILIDVDFTGAFPEFIGEFEPLDFNLDGTADFSINANLLYYYPDSYGTSYLRKRHTIKITPKGENCVQQDIVAPDLFDPASVLTAGNTINAAMDWFDAIPFPDQAWLIDYDEIDGDFNVDDWSSVDYKYAALRIKNGAGFNYAWIRLSVEEFGDYVIIHDYAYNNTLNAPILAGETGFCDEPVIYETNNITASSAKIKFAQVLNPTKYQIKYRAVGDVSWITVTASAGAVSKTLAGLSCATNYEVKMRAKCGAEYSDFSPLINFTTSSCRLLNNDNELSSVSIFPNPSSETVTIDLSTFKSDEVNVQVINLLGQIVFSENFILPGLIQIDISNFVKGNYIIKINSDEKSAVEKIIIQ